MSYCSAGSIHQAAASHALAVWRGRIERHWRWHLSPGREVEVWGQLVALTGVLGTTMVPMPRVALRLLIAERWGVLQKQKRGVVPLGNLYVDVCVQLAVVGVLVVGERMKMRRLLVQQQPGSSRSESQ